MKLSKKLLGAIVDAVNACTKDQNEERKKILILCDERRDAIASLSQEITRLKLQRQKILKQVRHSGLNIALEPDPDVDYIFIPDEYRL